MLIQLSMAIAAAAVLQAGAPPAPATSGAAQPTTAASTAPKEKKICRKIATSGTRMAERVCLTKIQWAKLDAEQ